MTSMFLIISFLLHMITLVAIFQLFKQLQLSKTKANDTQDIMQLMDTYLEEIREENRLLEKELLNKGPSTANREKPVQSENTARYSDRVNEYEPPAPKEEAEVTYVPPEQPAKDPDTPEMSKQAKILQLHSKGFSIEEIARRLNCGKTEAELIIKLHTKNHS